MSCMYCMSCIYVQPMNCGKVCEFRTDVHAATELLRFAVTDMAIDMAIRHAR